MVGAGVNGFEERLGVPAAVGFWDEPERPLLGSFGFSDDRRLSMYSGGLYHDWRRSPVNVAKCFVKSSNVIVTHRAGSKA